MKKYLLALALSSVVAFAANAAEMKSREGQAFDVEGDVVSVHPKDAKVADGMFTLEDGRMVKVEHGVASFAPAAK